MAALMNIKQRKEESTHDFISRFEAELDKVDSYDESWVLRDVHLGSSPRPGGASGPEKAYTVDTGFPAGQGYCFGRPDGKAPRN